MKTMKQKIAQILLVTGLSALASLFGLSQPVFPLGSRL